MRKQFHKNIRIYDNLIRQKFNIFYNDRKKCKFENERRSRLIKLSRKVESNEGRSLMSTR